MAWALLFMSDSVGKRLSQARLKKGLSIDAAAHATKVRPDKLLALENDDYSRFGNNAYAKGFLLLYGRFLDVDVSEQVRRLEIPGEIRVSEYQYLQNVPAPEPKPLLVRDVRPRKPSFVPLIVMAVVLVFAFFGFQFWIGYHRLQTLESGERARASQPAATPPVVSQTPEETAPLRPASTAAAASSPSVNTTAAPPSDDRTGATAPAPPTAPAVAPAAPATTAPLPTPPSGPNEVAIQALKKTWIEIRKDDPNSPPIFVDYLYPNAPQLKLRGSRFFIEARDPSAIQISKNGAPIAYQEPGVMVQ